MEDPLPQRPFKVGVRRPKAGCNSSHGPNQKRRRRTVSNFIPAVPNFAAKRYPIPEEYLSVVDPYHSEKWKAEMVLIGKICHEFPADVQINNCGNQLIIKNLEDLFHSLNYKFQFYSITKICRKFIKNIIY